MAFQAISKKSGKTYFLHQSGRMFYFAGTPGPNALEWLPEGYEVSENAKTGLPILRKVK